MPSRSYCRVLNSVRNDSRTTKERRSTYHNYLRTFFVRFQQPDITQTSVSIAGQEMKPWTILDNMEILSLDSASGVLSVML